MILSTGGAQLGLCLNIRICYKCMAFVQKYGEAKVTPIKCAVRLDNHGFNVSKSLRGTNSSYLWYLRVWRFFWVQISVIVHNLPLGTSITVQEGAFTNSGVSSIGLK